MSNEVPQFSESFLSRLTAEHRAIMQETDKQKLFQILRSVPCIVLQVVITYMIAYRQLLCLGLSAQEIYEEVKYVIPRLRQLLCGQVLPEFVAKFFNNKKMLRLAVNLPLGDQEKFLNNQSFKLLEPNGDYRMVLVDDLTPIALQQLIGKDGLNSDGQQAQWLSDQAKVKALLPLDEMPVKYHSKGVSILRPMDLSKKDIKALYDHFYK